jgi:serine/threonine-protein kinase
MLEQRHSTDTAAGAAMIGSRLGSWVIDKELGQGGMGTVYLAREAPTEGTIAVADAAPRTAAVKVLAPGLATDPGFVARFQREIEALRQLYHPNIVRFYDSGQEDTYFYYAMEYVDGRNLEEEVLERGRMPWIEVLDVALQVCPALKHAHDRGIIHRDLKPSNLMRSRPELPGAAPAPFGVVKLTDFGIAKVFATTHLTATGGVVGTAEYLSPEQAVGKPVSKRSDLYSFGIVLYTLLVGRTPFQGESVVDLLHKHRFAQFEKPTRLVPDLPHELEEVVCLLLEKDPARRPGDAGVLLRQLDSIRRKLERKARNPGTDGQGATVAAPAADGVDRGPGPATLMSRLMRQELESEKHGGPIRRFLNRPLVLVALLLLTVGLLVWGLWPTSAETLFRRGEALARSDNRDDWYEAGKVFDRLQQRYPDHPYKDEVADMRRQVKRNEDLAKAEDLAGRQLAISEAQWWYEEGLRLEQCGRSAEAERVWQNLVRGFDGVRDARPWVRLARLQLEPDKRGPGVLKEEQRWEPVHEALKRARQLRDDGKRDEAEEVWRALEELYRTDSSAANILERIRADRGK